MGVLKLVSLLFPFVRDMVLGESSLTYALKTNKRRVLLLILLMFCFGWTVYSIPRLVEMATEQVRLEHKVQDLTDHPGSLSDNHADGPIIPSQPTVVVVNHPTPAQPSEPDQPPQGPPVNVILNSTDFKARQQSWLTSLGDARSR
jgi:hypothetical protein